MEEDTQTESTLGHTSPTPPPPTTSPTPSYSKNTSPPPVLELDYQHQILDEICLEGLDGLTLQALWLRLGSRPGYTLGLSENAKLFAWEIIEQLDQVSFYRLGQARPEDIYPFCLVDDQLTVA